MPPRVRRVDSSQPGWTRHRAGKGFTYHDVTGAQLSDPDTLARIEAIVIPPAWGDVWICPTPWGHLQATGVDARGRRQYRYHDRWRELQEGKKFDHVLDFARVLPQVRAQVALDLARPRLDRPRVLACAVRLLDLGFFRVGSEEYAEENSTFGLATLRKDHVRIARDGQITFDYIAKSGKHRVHPMRDSGALAVLSTLRRRRGGGAELLAWQQGGRWVDVRSGDINEHLVALAGMPCSAKDFRTWNATLLAAVALAVSAPMATSVTGRKRAISRAVKETATYLGNTPAVCRASYIHPRVIDDFQQGITISAALGDLGAHGHDGQLSTHGPAEVALLDQLCDPPEAPATDAPALELLAAG